jgi:Holliday junction resolvase RusA-like endonuclease
MLTSGKQTRRERMRPLIIKIPLKPVPAARPRIPRYGKPYYPKTYSKWIADAEKIVAESTLELAEPLRVDVLFLVPRSKTSKLIVPVGDGDNYEKALYDMLQKKGYLSDDKWIVTATWKKRFLPFGKVGWCQIVIEGEPEEIDYEY